MSTIGRQYKPQRSFFNGVDNTTPLESPDIANTLSEGLNVEMVDNDILKTRPGYLPSTNARNGYIVREGIEYVKSDGTRENIVYLVSTTATGSSGILARKTNATYTDIATGLPDGIKPCMVQARTLLFVFTGVSDFIYDGTTTRQIGITAPSVEPQINNLIAGNLNDSSYYRFVYTYYNTVTGAESSPSLPSAVITSGTAALGTNGIRIQVTPGSPTTADQIKVYRTVGGGGIYFLDGTAAITATTYDSILADSGLGTELELDNERLPEAAKFAVLMDNRLFVAGFASNKNRIMHSKIGINGPMFESFQAADLVDCNPNDGDEIMGLGKIGYKVGVVKRRSAGKLIQIDLTNTGLERSGYQKYIYKGMNAPCTASNHHSIFSIKDAMCWLGRDNVYLTDGMDVVAIGSRIRNTIRSFNFNQSYKFSAYRLTENSQVIISVCQSSSNEPDYQLVAHYMNFPSIAWTMFSPGINTTTHPGLPIASMWTTVINEQDEMYFGNSDGTGYISLYGNGDSDNGKAIYFSVKGQWEPGPDAMAWKGYQSFKYLATTKAASPNNILTNTWEEDGKSYVIKSNNSTIATTTKWGTAKWGTFKWGGLVYTLAQFYPNRKAHLGRWGILNDDLNSPFAIKSARLLYRVIPE